MPAQLSDRILDTLKRASASLRDAGLPFALGGGLAGWARGGPPTDHDIDLLIRESDVDAALAVLEAAGMRPERPPEGWLVKAWDGDLGVDLIHHPFGMVVDDELFARCDELSVGAIRMLVLPVEDLLTTKLLALNEQHLDFSSSLAHARALREQIDWTGLAERTRESPYARAFMALARELGVATARPVEPVGQRGVA